METSTQKERPRFVWTRWLMGYSFGTLAGLFLLLSVVDLVATLSTVGLGVRHGDMSTYEVLEGNPLANIALTHYGPLGFAVYKLMLVGIVLISTWLVDHSNQRLARGVLWGGIFVMTYVTFYHLIVMWYVFTGDVWG